LEEIGKENLKPNALARRQQKLAGTLDILLLLAEFYLVGNVRCLLNAKL